MLHGGCVEEALDSGRLRPALWGACLGACGLLEGFVRPSIGRLYGGFGAGTAASTHHSLFSPPLGGALRLRR
ncbi:MAG: hypothetical protein DRJ69_02500 [Thermoprotei archaeon]|nr:MAG: hypothetical protein DRJ69_02500 [Thermoprotei archaeon]